MVEGSLVCVDEAEQPNSRTAEQPNSRTAEQPNSRTAEQPNSDLKKAVSNLYQWQYGVRDETNFVFQLYTLLQRAGPEEFDKLAQVYPCEAEAYRLWYRSSSPEVFFTSFGVWRGPRTGGNR
jgi:hypothetical protein